MIATMAAVKFLLVFIFFLIGCRHKTAVLSEAPKKLPPQTLTQGKSFDRYDLKSQVLQKLASGEGLLWGGLSALNYAEQDSYGNLFFWSMTGRGPAGPELIKDGQVYRPFLVPDFHPSLVKLRVNKMDRTLEVIESIPLKSVLGEFLNGLPPAASEKFKYEIPVDMSNQVLTNAVRGIDPESLTLDDDKHFWVGEQYLPSLLEFDAQGALLKQIEPAAKFVKKLKKDQLPYEYRLVKMNRGFRAIGYYSGRIFFMPQSPLDIDPKPNFIRIGVFNIKKRKYDAEYLYPLESSKVDKIGDLHMLNEKQLIVIEQNSESGSKGVHRLYKVDLTAATNVLKAGFEGAPELTAPYAFPKNFNFAKKTLLLDLVKEGFTDFENVDGLTLIDDTTAAVLTNNDFGVDGDKIVVRPTALGIFKIKSE